MVGSTGTLMTMRLVRSKLRKRDETSVSPVSVEAQTTTTQPPTTVPSQVLSAEQTAQNNAPIAYRQNPSSVWVFPPLPPQPNIYCTNNHDALNHVNEKNGFKGFRKQFSGRFKRLVAKKSHEPAPAIPPELKPQLKTIYVY